MKFIRLGHELGLGVGDPKEIEIVGDDISAEDWGFVQEDTFASRGQKLIYHGALKPFENVLLRSPIVPWSYFASQLLPQRLLVPVRRAAARRGGPGHEMGAPVQGATATGDVVMPGMEPRTAAVAAGGLALGALLLGAVLLRGRGRGPQG